ncbi:MAG: hypothetical protein ABSG78_18650 [Verrucomicrobiota bacterium]|jgi:hypothetical protein
MRIQAWQLNLAPTNGHQTKFWTNEAIFVNLQRTQYYETYNYQSLH